MSWRLAAWCLLAALLMGVVTTTPSISKMALLRSMKTTDHHFEEGKLQEPDASLGESVASQASNPHNTLFFAIVSVLSVSAQSLYLLTIHAVIANISSSPSYSTSPLTVASVPSG